jgi:hypothetical protein
MRLHAGQPASVRVTSHLEARLPSHRWQRIGKAKTGVAANSENLVATASSTIARKSALASRPAVRFRYVLDRASVTETGHHVVFRQHRVRYAVSPASLARCKTDRRPPPIVKPQL